MCFDIAPDGTWCGGVKTRDGRMVKRGLVYRSQAFNFNAVENHLLKEYLIVGGMLTRGTMMIFR